MSVLKKPVNPNLRKASHIKKLKHSRKLTDTAVSEFTDLDTDVLPKEEKKRKGAKIPKVRSSSKPRMSKKVFLNVLYDHVPPPEPEPPCGDCKNAPCCKAFIVALTAEEVASGRFDDYLVTVKPHVSKQLMSSSILRKLFGYNAVAFLKDKEVYVLDGPIDMPCPYLKDNKCGIYENRPLTCRVYSCVDDPRITDYLRNGEIYGF